MDSFIERLRKTNRCRPEIRKLAEDMASLAPTQYDKLAAGLTESGEDHALGILLNAAAVNEIRLEPAVLANALGSVDIISDIKYPYNFQDETAIAPLLTAALSEGLSWERQALAARLAAELAIKFNSPVKPVKRVLQTLMEEIRPGEAKIMLSMTLDLIENRNEALNRRFRLIGTDILAELPEKRPPVFIGSGGTVKRPVSKLGRNEPCRCGSGRKYKKCCFDEDQKIMRDASSYEGITRSQLGENPSLVDDTSYIEGLRTYELKKLVPSKLNDEQLFSAYRRADHYGLRDLALGMLLELKDRPGKEEFAIDHMQDLFDSALRAQDLDIIRRLSLYLPEDKRYCTPADKLKHELLEQPDKFADLEAICRKTFDDNKDHYLLELSIAFEDILPALSVVFGRAAIVSEPGRWLDNELLIETIHKGRLALDLELEDDPIEDYWEWLEDKESEGTSNKDKDEKIRNLEAQLSEAKGKGLSAQKELQDKVKELDGLEKKLQAVNTVVPAKKAEQTEQIRHITEQSEEEKRHDISELRKKIEALKVEISSQQESRRQLRKDLQEAHDIISKRNSPGAPLVEAHDKGPESLLVVPEKVRVPEFTDSFRKSCEDLSPDLVIKAMQAAVGFASRDSSVLRQTKGLERMPDYYRIRIGLYHRLMVRKTSKNEWQILEVIQRKDLDSWIHRHGH